MKRIVPIILLIVSVVGCATSQDAPSFATAPTPELISGNAVLYIYRISAAPLAWSAYLEIDEQQAASLANQGFTWVYVTPGTHRFKFGWPLLAGMPSVKFERTFEPRKVYAFEMQGNISGGSTTTVTSGIQPTAIDTAKQIMRSCCRYVAPTATMF